MSSSRLLPRLREDLEFTRSPLPDRPGVFIRDPFRYSEASMVVPPLLVGGLTLFDGSRTQGELRDRLARQLAPSSPVTAADIAEELFRALSSAGFLQDSRYRRLREERLREFREAPHRRAAHAGAGYPSDSRELSSTMASWVARMPAQAGPPVAAMGGPAPVDALAEAGVVGVAAPHATPGADPDSYVAAYRSLGSELSRRTFVILGTSHYGTPNRFGLTRKPFQTPLGCAPTATQMVEELVAAAPAAFEVEDYCHSIEHSIEFQVLFLQHRFGPDVRILPILCGPFFFDRALAKTPEADRGVAEALAALANLHARQSKEICWVLGVDMAHLGRRYGDPVGVQAHDPTMEKVARRERERIDAIVDGDATRFWRHVHESGDDELRWCGSSPIYTFLRAVPQARARLLRYHQWNIDEASVVTFAALSFHQN